MNKTNIEYVMDIFRALSSEMPEQMLYRENGDSIELRTPDSIESCMPFELQSSGWNLISSHMAEVA